MGAVFAGALEGSGEVGVAGGGVAEVVDPACDVVVDDEREIGLGGLQLRFNFADELGVGGEGHLVRGFGGSFFDLAGEAIALLEGDHLQRVDGGEELVELVGELGIVFEIQAAGEHGIDGDVKVLARCVETVGVVVGDAGLVVRLRRSNQGLHLLCALGGRDGVCGLLCLRLCLSLGLIGELLPLQGGSRGIRGRGPGSGGTAAPGRGNR